MSENQPIGSSSASANTARPIQRRHTEPQNAGNGSTSFAALNRIATQPEGSSKKPNVHRTMSRTFSLRRAATSMLQPTKKIGPAPSVWKSIRSVLLSSWLNVLLICIPVSWALNFAMKDSHTLVFVFSFLAIIPLAKLLAFATDELSMRVGQTLAGLLNATLGNAVELIVAIIALIHCQLGIVQSSLVGSILSNLLLVLGMCFFAGGMKYSEQGFGVSATQLNSSLLTISVIAVLLPAAFHMVLSSSTDTTTSTPVEGADLLKLSHGVALILLFIYASYLCFQLYSHASIYEDTSADVITSKEYTEKLFHHKKKPASPTPTADNKNLTDGSDTIVTAVSRTVTGDHIANGKPHDLESHAGTGEEEPVEELQMNLWTTVGLLVVVTVFVAITAEWLVDSIDGLTDTGKISKEFVGIILLPIVGNAAEHVTAVTVSVKDKLTLSLGVAVGSSIQIALFVIPFIVTLAWIMGKPLTFLFDPYESIALFLAVLTVNYVVQDGKSNWLEGMILMCLYVILALTFWFYPGSDVSQIPGLFPTC